MLAMNLSGHVHSASNRCNAQARELSEGQRTCGELVGACRSDANAKADARPGASVGQSKLAEGHFGIETRDYARLTAINLRATGWPA
jgi:hypothetical protein